MVKLLSKTISHKSDVGGVVLDIASARAARDAARAIQQRAEAAGARVDGFAVQPMVVRRQSQELILGVSRDPIFGPVILFGAGGVAVELIDDTAMALPPLDDVLAGDLIERTRIGRLLAGYRDRKPADRAAIVSALIGISQMIVDFPCIVAMDINPLLADADGVVALDARLEIEPGDVDVPGPQPGARHPAVSGGLGEADVRRRTAFSHPSDQTGGFRALSGFPGKSVARRHPASLSGAAKQFSRRDAAAADAARL